MDKSEPHQHRNHCFCFPVTPSQTFMPPYACMLIDGDYSCMVLRIRRKIACEIVPHKHVQTLINQFYRWTLASINSPRSTNTSLPACLSLSLCCWRSTWVDSFDLGSTTPPRRRKMSNRVSDRIRCLETSLN